MDLNTEECRHKEAEKKQKSRGKQMAENPQECRNKNANSKEKWRVKGKSDERKALIRFQNATRHGPIFICSCCYTRQFQENSLKLEKVKKKINTEIFQKCIPEGQEVIVKTCVNNISTAECYICKTCNRHMQKGKMPPECRQNNMQIDPQPEIMKLTELENSLIARNILFEKMYMLPTSRYTATTGKIINVPVPEDSALNTINRLPRTPDEAGLIGVEVKRKLAFKNSHHKAQLINVEKIYKAIDHLKKSGNPYYQFYDDYHAYEERCVNSDSDNIISKSLHNAWDEDIMKDLTDLDLNKQSDDNMHIASKLQSVELLKDMKVGETYKAAVSTTPPGFEPRVNVNFIIDMLNLTSEQQIKDWEDGTTCITMCADPNVCKTSMTIYVKILCKTVYWIVCRCHASQLPVLIT